MKIAFLIIFIFVTFFYLNCVTIIKDFSYKAKMIDTEKTSRSIAFEQIKSLLLEAFGYNIYYTVKTEKPSLKSKLDDFSIRQIGLIATDLAKAKIIEEDWKDNIFYIKAELKADDIKILSDIGKIIEDNRKIVELNRTFAKIKDTLAELEEIGRKFIETVNDLDKSKMQSEYLDKIELLSAKKWFARGSFVNELSELENTLSRYQKIKNFNPVPDKKYHNKLWEKAYTDNYDTNFEIGDEKMEISGNNKSAGFSNLNEEISYYQKSIEECPDQFYVYNDLGIALLKQNKFEEAEESFRQAISFNENYAGAYNNLGLLFLKKNDFGNAITNFRQAISLKKDFCCAYNNLGITYMKLHDFEKAIECFNSAAAVKPDDAKSFYNLGFAYTKYNNPDSAIEYYARSIELDPGNEQAYFNIAIVYDEIGEKQKAIENYLYVTGLNSRNIKALFNLGGVYSDLNDHQNAIDNYRKILEIKPDDVRTLYNLSIIYGKLGEQEKDLEYTKKAADLGFEPAQAYLLELEESKLSNMPYID